MKKRNSVQLEIFSLDNANLKTPEQPKTFLNYIWNYEKSILIIIAFLVTGIVSFTLGFERGRRITLKTGATSEISEQKGQIQEDTKALPVKIEVIKDIEDGKPKESVSVTLASSKPSTATVEYQKNYTIQVATYKSKTYAQREEQLLKNKGLQPLVFSKGNYIQLCVGKFVSKEEAKLSLKELKKRYQDCFIRRL